MHGGWCWDRLRPHLQHQSLAIDLPGRHPAATSDLSVRDYIAHAERAVVERGWQKSCDRAFVWRRHGLRSCLRDPPAKVRHVVFIASVILYPARGPSTSPESIAATLRTGFGHAVARGGSYKLPDRIARYLFCNDFNPAEILICNNASALNQQT